MVKKTTRPTRNNKSKAKASKPVDWSTLPATVESFEPTTYVDGEIVTDVTREANSIVVNTSTTGATVGINGSETFKVGNLADLTAVQLLGLFDGYTADSQQLKVVGGLELLFNELAKKLHEERSVLASLDFFEALKDDRVWEALNKAGLELRNTLLDAANVKEIVLADPTTNQITHAREWIETDGVRRQYIRKTARLKGSERIAKLDRQDRMDLIKVGFKPELFDRVVTPDSDQLGTEIQGLVDQLHTERLSIETEQADLAQLMVGNAVAKINDQLAAGVPNNRTALLITVLDQQRVFFKILVDRISSPAALSQALVQELKRLNVSLKAVQIEPTFLTSTEAVACIVDENTVHSPVLLVYSTEAEAYLSTVLFINKESIAYSYDSVQTQLKVQTEMLTAHQVIERLVDEQTGSLSITVSDPGGVFHTEMLATGIEGGNRGVGDVGVYNYYIDQNYAAVAQVLKNHADAFPILTWVGLASVYKEAEVVDLDQVLTVPKPQPPEITGTVEPKADFETPLTVSESVRVELNTLTDRQRADTLIDINQQLGELHNRTVLDDLYKCHPLYFVQVNAHSPKATTFVVRGAIREQTKNLMMGILKRQLDQKVIEAPVTLELELPQLDTIEPDLLANWDLVQEVLFIDQNRCESNTVIQLARFEQQVVEFDLLQQSVRQNNRTFSGFNLAELLEQLEDNTRQLITVLALDPDYELGDALKVAGLDYQGHQTGGCIRYVFETTQPLPESVKTCLFRMQADAKIATSSLAKPSKDLPSFDWGFDSADFPTSVTPAATTDVTETNQVVEDSKPLESVTRTLFIKEAAGRCEVEGLITRTIEKLLEDYQSLEGADKYDYILCQVYSFNQERAITSVVSIYLDEQARPVAGFHDDVPFLVSALLDHPKTSLVEGKVMAGTQISFTLDDGSSKAPGSAWQLVAEQNSIKFLSKNNAADIHPTPSLTLWESIKRRIKAWFN